MSDKTPDLPPPSEPFPGSLTPGWNDPPPLTQNTQANNSSISGRPRLNKRIAFPLQGTPTSTATNSAFTSSSTSSSPVVATVKPIAKVQPHCASVQPTQASNSGPLPPLPPRADVSSWPIATVQPRTK